MKKNIYAFSLCIFSWLFSMAQEPTAQPTNMVFTTIKPYRFNMSFTGSGADGYLVLKSDKPITNTPSDGIVYEKGQGLSSCKVMSANSSTNFAVREVLEGTKYYFKVFAFNGTGSSINYRTVSPLTDSVVTTAADPADYYATINPGSNTFANDLHNLINPHIMALYGSYKANIVPAIFERDTTGNQVVIYCEYSNEVTIYTPPFEFTPTNYSREHCICKSWMKTHPDRDVTDYPEGSDFFNLLLTKLNFVNNIRSDNPVGEVVSPAHIYKECRSGKNADSVVVFEPREDKKGDLARSMLYELVCYDQLSGSWGFDSLLSFGSIQDESILKQWHQQDPPDKFERTKNEYIYSLQDNRNPFIDHPEWLECIDFSNISRAASCTLTTVNDVMLETEIKLYPNPAGQYMNVEFGNENGAAMAFEVYDMSGRRLMELKDGTIGGMGLYNIPVNGFQNGNYILKISADGRKHAFRKFVVIH